MAQSPDGYLWFSADSGLVRFDGVRFTVLDGRQVPALRAAGKTKEWSRPHLVDRGGRLWISRRDGALVTYAAGTFRVALPAPPDVRYRRVFQDGAGTLWIAGDSAGHGWMRRWDGRRPVPGSWPAGVPETGIERVVPDTGHGMWVGTRREGLWHVSSGGARHLPMPGGGRTESTVPHLQTDDGTVWVGVSGDEGGLFRVRDGRWMPVRLTPDAAGLGISDIVALPSDERLSPGDVYLGTRGHGLLRWRAGRLERRVGAPAVAGTVVYDLLTDGDGTVWASTDLGVERLRHAPFVTLGPRDGLPLEVPFEIGGDSTGAIWMTSREDALFRLSGGVVHGRPGAMTARRAATPGGVRFQLLRAAHDGAWAAPAPGGLLHADAQRVRRFGQADGLPQGRIWNLAEDSTGAAWVGFVREGAGRLGPDGYRPVTAPDGSPFTGGARFVAGEGGRFVALADFDRPSAFAVRSDGTLRRLDSLGPLRRPLDTYAVEGVDSLWGIAPADPPMLIRVAGGRAVEVPLAGLPPGLGGMATVLVVGDGSLWFGSQTGVGRYPLAVLHAAADSGTPLPPPQLFGEADGLAAPRLSSYGRELMFRGADGRIWLSTPAGLAVVTPRRVPASRLPPPVHVEEVVVDGRTLARGDLFRIPANPERLTIHYTAASPRMPERVRVQYRLDGVDAAWQEGSAPRVATYTQLRPGRYRFRVRAWNEDGVPSTGEATLAMRVLPAWYQTPWAAALGLAGVAGIGAAGASGVARVRRRRAEAAEQATIAERVRVARELHDTILSDLAGLAMRLDAAAVNAGRVASPAGPDLIVLPELRDHARRTLDETRRAVTAMRVSTVQMVPLWAQLAEVARRVCDGASVATSFRYVGRPRRYAPELEAEALRIAGEALTNACRHSGGREVAVTCTYGRAALVVSVRDDGCGFDPARDGAAAAEAGHWGLLGMRERALALGGTLDIDSAPGRGTTVRLRLPARQAARRG